MKFIRTPLMLASFLLLGACTTLNPAQRNVVNGLERTALDAGVGYISGGFPLAAAYASEDALATLSAATLGLRGLEVPNIPPPSAGEVISALKIGMSTPEYKKVADKIGPPVADAIVKAVVESGGKLTTASAIEIAAKGLDAAVQHYLEPKLGASVAQGFVRLASTPYTPVRLEDQLFPGSR